MKYPKKIMCAGRTLFFSVSFALADAGAFPARLKVVDAERTYRRERSEDGEGVISELNN